VESIDISLSLALSSKLLGQFFVDRSAMSHGQEAEDSSLVVDCIDDANAANAIFA